MSTEPEITQKTLGTCSKCGVELDLLRAARVRLISGRFHHFCSMKCAESFTLDDLQSTPDAPAPLAQEVLPMPTPLSVTGLTADSVQSAAEWAVPASNEPQQLTAARDAATPDTASAVTSLTPSPKQTDNAGQAAPLQELDVKAVPGRSQRLLNGSMALAALSIVLVLARESSVMLYLRAALVLLGSAGLGLHARRYNPDPKEVSLLQLLTVPVAASLLAIVAAVVEPEQVSLAIGFSATLVIACATSTSLLQYFGSETRIQRLSIAAQLDQPVSRVEGDQVNHVAPNSLRPGEEIVVHAGESVAADVTVRAGTAEVRPWPNANELHAVAPGDSIYAGAKLMSGQLRATVRWTGHDRQWQRLTLDEHRRADLHAPLVALGRRVSQTGTLLGAAGTAAIGAFFQQDLFNLAMATLAIGSAISNPALYGMPALTIMQTVLGALRQGIVFQSAQALEAAGRISTAAFCARGTLLIGEPELSSVESFGKLTQDEVLALVAGAELGRRDPVAVGIARAARARGVQADAVRTPDRLPGLGTTAVTSAGQSLVVGSRALMLQQRISVARAEERITELEAMGRSALLVAVDGHLAGILALQDGLRAGARAAVQRLLDAGIEPVLISGDARQTCEALGKSIDIDHVRPEVLPTDRGQEVERLKSGGASVAVIGRTPTDDIALSAASVSIVLPSPGLRAATFDVELGSNQVQRAAIALGLARHCRAVSMRAFTIILGTALFSTVLVFALELPAVLIPLCSIAATVLAGVLSFGAQDPPKVPDTA